LKTGTGNPYSLTAMQNVGGHYVPAPPYTDTAADANPETLFMLPRIKLSTHVSERRSRHGRFLRARISLAGRMSPATAGEALRFTIQRFRHGAWRTRARARRRLHTDGSAKISVKVSRAGRYRARASFAGDTINAPARSAWTRFRVAP
jgi:predicted aspartyl protease